MNNKDHKQRSMNEITVGNMRNQENGKITGKDKENTNEKMSIPGKEEKNQGTVTSQKIFIGKDRQNGIEKE